MSAPARTVTEVNGKEITILIKKPAGTEYILFGCVTSADLDSPGAEVEEIACRSGVTRSASADIGIPTIIIENIVRHYATGDQATNISDDEIQQWNDAATTIGVKYSVGSCAGDPVYTGDAFINGYSRKAPQKGKATGSAKINFLAMPVRTTLS